MNNECHSKNKRIPKWIFKLHSKYLKILLESLIASNGSENKNKNSISYKYSTTSETLANDIQRLVFLCGYSPCLVKTLKDIDVEYIISWVDNDQVEQFIINNKNSKCASFSEIDYNGLVWCFETPTGVFVTRRNGKISIQGNSKFAQADGMVNPLTLVKVGNPEFRPTPTDLESWRQLFANAAYDKDMKIFTHDAVSVERIGHAQGIYDISSDITQLIKEIYIGLMVPSVLMDGQDTTYANGSVALDTLRQRYLQFRNMMALWLKRKIFAPISKLNDFYEYVDGKKVLIVPDIDWNHMSLFDMSDYISHLTSLSQGEASQRKVSLQTVYRSLGLNYEDEMRKMRFEDIQETIRNKELESLNSYSLNDLRALGPDDEIAEALESPIVGENVNVEQSTVPGEMTSGIGDLSLPSLPGAPPSAPMGANKLKPAGPPGGGTGIGRGNIPKPPMPT